MVCQMKRKILAVMVVVLCMMTIVVPVVSGKDWDNILNYINENVDISEHPGKIYSNVLIMGIGHNQIEIDTKYKNNDKWIIDGVEFDLVIAPYMGNFKDGMLAAAEVAGVPVVSNKAFEPYKGALFENVIAHSGGGPALRNQRELGNIKTRTGHVTFLGDPNTYSPHYKMPGDHYVGNPKDSIRLCPSLIAVNKRTPGIGWTLSFGPGASSVQKGPGTGHYLKEYFIADYAPAEFVVDKINIGPETGQSFDESLGGVDFTSIQLNYISTSTYSDSLGQMQNFDFVLKAKKAEKSDEIINIEDATELSLNSFFIGLTLPESKFWVNLNPWKPDVIADEDLRKTDVGGIMLEADLQMKKDFCKYANPCESEIGEEYWELLNKKSEELAEECMKKHPAEIEGTDNVLFSPVTRHWIVPDKTDVYGTDYEVYIVDMTLNIESDPVYNHSTYQIINQNPSLSDECKEDLDEAAKEYGRYAMELDEVMILPLVVQEVNHGGYYSDLRQVYISLALAQWYKDKIWHTSGIFTNLIDSKDLTELESKYIWDVEDVWRDYVKSFEEGEYHCCKNRTYEKGDYIITESRLYSSGGVDFTDIELTNIGDIPSGFKELTSEAIYTHFANDGDDYYFGDGLYMFYLSSTPTTPEPTKPMQTPHQNNNVTHLVDTPTSGEDSPKDVPEFKVVFAIVGLLVATYLLRNRK